MVDKLHIDIETYSSIDIKTAGAYKYCRSIDFEILLVAFAFSDNPIRVIDLARGESLPPIFLWALQDPKIEKHAHNAAFEREAFKAYGYDIPIKDWRCSMVKSAYCGYPLPLAMLSKALKLDGFGKLSTGKALIRYFCIPCKPTKVNAGRTRNLPEHDVGKWMEFKEYCAQDVAAEREADRRLEGYSIPAFERENYILDQEINTRGLLVDLTLAKNAVDINRDYTDKLLSVMKDLTGLENPNSPAQLKKWLSEAMQKDVITLAKDTLPGLKDEAGAGPVSDVLDLRIRLAKTSIKKYTAMQACADYDGRVRGLLQFYGANRTGRWAGRLVQVQNLPRNYLKLLTESRELVLTNNREVLALLYDNITDVLSQLIRTAFVAPEGKVFAVADFSAIEARVIAWLAGESWRMEVFNTHGKIYEASASKMFNVPLEDIGKGSEYRQKGKIAELALGYGGAVGALKTMGGESMGLSTPEMKNIVTKWREANKSITTLWKKLEAAAKLAIRTGTDVKYKNLLFSYDGKALIITLPSGRALHYVGPIIGINKFGGKCVKYYGIHQETRSWRLIDTYGGKLSENIVQAIARDLLAYSMLLLNRAGYPIVMHVHDEAIAEVDEATAEESLVKMCEIMGTVPAWAEGLPLNAEGYITPFYKKD